MRAVVGVGGGGRSSSNSTNSTVVAVVVVVVVAVSVAAELTPMKLFTNGRIPSTLSAYFIIIRHQLGLDRPVSASSSSLFKDLPSRFRPFDLPYFRTISGILLLFILVTCRNQFDFNFLGFSSNGSTSTSSKISSFLS